MLWYQFSCVESSRCRGRGLVAFVVKAGYFGHSALMEPALVADSVLCGS